MSFNFLSFVVNTTNAGIILSFVGSVGWIWDAICDYRLRRQPSGAKGRLILWLILLCLGFFFQLLGRVFNK